MGWYNYLLLICKLSQSRISTIHLIFFKPNSATRLKIYSTQMLIFNFFYLSGGTAFIGVKLAMWSFLGRKMGRYYTGKNMVTAILFWNAKWLFLIYLFFPLCSAIFHKRLSLTVCLFSYLFPRNKLCGRRASCWILLPLRRRILETGGFWSDIAWNKCRGQVERYEGVMWENEINEGSEDIMRVRERRRERHFF